MTMLCIIYFTWQLNQRFTNNTLENACQWKVLDIYLELFLAF